MSLGEVVGSRGVWSKCAVFHYQKTSIWTIDETALWLKLRCEEKVFISMAEILHQERRRKTKRAMKEARQKAEEEVDGTALDALATTRGMPVLQKHLDKFQPLNRKKISASGSLH